jgi:hypothetical protein
VWTLLSFTESVPLGSLSHREARPEHECSHGTRFSEGRIEDIKNRTLAGIPGNVGRLVCLASTRDYNTGRYYHDGLASNFSEEVAGEALAACHLEIFKQVTLSSLKDIVRQLESYVLSSHARPAEVIEAWEKLETYRVTIPLKCDSLWAEFFFSNVKIALAILRSRLGRDPGSQ